MSVQSNLKVSLFVTIITFGDDAMTVCMELLGRRLLFYCLFPLRHRLLKFEINSQRQTPKSCVPYLPCGDSRGAWYLDSDTKADILFGLAQIQEW
jgi:hypothetical protein